jgi:hypothetical protein
MSEPTPKRAGAPFSADDPSKKGYGPFSTKIAPVKTTLAATARPDAPALCERCGAEMYRMHAVWRCPSCGFKTDCCGW